MKKLNSKLAVSAISCALMFALSGPATAADSLVVSGSSSVFPFAEAAASTFAVNTGAVAPQVKSVGSTSGIAQICSGEGQRYIDVATASRRIHATEAAACTANGTELVELKIGYDGIVVVANKSNKLENLNLIQFYRALGKKVPNSAGVQAVNDSQSWDNIDSDLPAADLSILGPDTSRGTFGSIAELILEPACARIPQLKALSKSTNYMSKLSYKTFCQMVRDDGRYKGFADYEEIAQQLSDDVASIALVPSSVYYAHADTLKVISIDGVAPTPATIASNDYPLVTPLYLYVTRKNLQADASLAQFLQSFADPTLWGMGDVLSGLGMIPLSDSERNQTVAALSTAKPLAL